MILRLLLLIGVAVASILFAEAATIDHDKVQPFAQPDPVTISEKAAVKFKPSLLIISGCHPYPAVNAAGDTSGGLKGTGDQDEGCKGSSLGSQVYARAGWHKDLWAIMYAWYLPKERGFQTFGKGHRHKWVSAVVWLANPAVETPKVLAISTWRRVNAYEVFKDGPPKCRRHRRGPPTCDFPFAELFNGTSAKLTYERYVFDNFGYHMVRPVSAWNNGNGEFQDLIMWEQLTDEARTALSETDFGEKAPVSFIDANFNATLEQARPFL